MEQSTINQRIRFLIEKLAPSARAFSDAIGDSPTNTQNYIGPRQTAPKHEYLAKVVRHYSNVNSHWLLTGEGEPFKDGQVPTQNQTNISGKKNTTNIAGSHGTVTNNYNLSDCEKERDTFKAQLDKAQREIELLTEQLGMKDTIIQGKDEMLDLLRGGFNRLN